MSTYICIQKGSQIIGFKDRQINTFNDGYIERFKDIKGARLKDGYKQIDQYMYIYVQYLET